MRLGLYVLASIMLMGLVGTLTHIFINPNDYNSEVLANTTLPVGVWIIIPMFLLMLASLVHIMFYGTKNFFKFKRWEKDSQTLTNALYWSLLHEPKPHKFNLPKLKASALLFQTSTIKVHGTIDGVSEKVQSALNIISELDKGECVDFREKKLAGVLSTENPLVIKNHINCLKKNSNFAEEVLLSKEKYGEEVFEKALDTFVKSTDLSKAKKYTKIFTRHSFISLMSRITRDDNLGITTEILDEFISDLHSELKCSDFLLIANITKKQFSPDDNLKLFKQYDKQYVKAQTAYLYLLFEYEMIEKAGEYLDEHDVDEFMRFRALYDLKKEHNRYKITDLMNIKHICNDS